MTKRRGRRWDLLALGGYTLIALAYAWPLVRSFGSALAGVGQRDQRVPGQGQEVPPAPTFLLCHGAILTVPNSITPLSASGTSESTGSRSNSGHR